jgi:hypothetical protein
MTNSTPRLQTKLFVVEFVVELESPSYYIVIAASKQSPPRGIKLQPRPSKLHMIDQSGKLISFL